MATLTDIEDVLRALVALGLTDIDEHDIRAIARSVALEMDEKPKNRGEVDP
jgi:hypothetical protein